MYVYWIFQFLGWLTFTIGNLLYTFVISGELIASDFLFAGIIFVSGYFFSHFLHLHTIKYKWLELHILKLFLYFELASLLLGALTYVVLFLFNNFIFYFAPINFSLNTFASISFQISTIYFTWCLIYFLINFFRNFKKEEIKNLKKEAELQNLEFNILKSQLNPHFMFNSMNVIRALIDEDTHKAKEGISKLSNILRTSLTIDHRKFITINEELKFIKDYLSLEKMRFEERLEVEFLVDEETHKYLIPPMIVQTLVENAIKHGISKQVKGGIVQIIITKSSKHIYIKITNPGKFLGEKNQGNGVLNSKLRLAYLYNDKADLKIINEKINEENLVVTTLKVPIKLNNDAS